MTQDSKHIFVTEDDEVFVSPNSSTLPCIPRMQDAVHEDMLPRDTRTLLWSNNAYFYLAYVLRSDLYTGPIFQRLSFPTLQSLPMEHSYGTWRLPMDIQNSWARLETGLRVVISHLFKGSLLPFDFAYFRMPSQYGWGRDSGDQQYARKLAMRSRDAFNPLMALCSAAIASHLHRDLDPLTDNPKWAQTLIEKGVHPEWVTSLRQSAVADFSPGKRVGIIVHMDRCQFLDCIPDMIRANVPVWLYWGPVKSIFSPSHRVATMYRPPLDAIKAKQAGQGDTEMQQADSVFLVSYPEPERHTGQKRGETWQDFFARREESNARRIARENEVDTQKRQNREREAEAHLPPGRQGPVVFQWHDVDGFRVRTRVFRAYVETMWDGYAKSQ